MNSIPTVGILLFQDDKVLLVKHGEAASHITGSYGLPAGRIEKGETAKQAAIRELQEETGLIARENELEELPIELPPVDIKRSDGTTKRFSITIFLCRKFHGKLIQTEETIPEWIDRNTINTLPLIVNVKVIIEKGMKLYNLSS